jgi:hypothetical protein
MTEEKSLLRDATGTAKPGAESKMAKYIRIAIVCLAGVFGVLFVVMGILGKHRG